MAARGCLFGYAYAHANARTHARAAAGAGGGGGGVGAHNRTQTKKYSPTPGARTAAAHTYYADAFADAFADAPRAHRSRPVVMCESERNGTLKNPCDCWMR